MKKAKRRAAPTSSQRAQLVSSSEIAPVDSLEPAFASDENRKHVLAETFFPAFRAAFADERCSVITI